MALFKRNFDKPGPGVPKNAPRKKGIARFFEILGRDFGQLVKLNLLYQLCVLPSQIFLGLTLTAFLALDRTMMMVFALAALAFGVLVGPATTALNHGVSKMMRDDPGFIWHDFKKIFKENFRSMAIPGILYSLILGAEIFAFLYYFILSAAGNSISFVLVVIYLFSVLLFTMASPYFFLQAGYLELKTGGILKNSLLLAIANAPRTLVGALINGGLMIVQLYFFPYPFMLTIFFGYAIPTLLNLMWIWPPFDKTFKIEETLRKRESGEEEEGAEEPGADSLPGREGDTPRDDGEDTPD